MQGLSIWLASLPLVQLHAFVFVCLVICKTVSPPSELVSHFSAASENQVGVERLVLRECLQGWALQSALAL